MKPHHICQFIDEAIAKMPVARQQLQVMRWLQDNRVNSIVGSSTDGIGSLFSLEIEVFDEQFQILKRLEMN